MNWGFRALGTGALRIPGHFVLRSWLRHRFRRGSSRMLFVVGHMRSGSTLLVHILVNNPEIVGYGESHRGYAPDMDLARVAARIYWRSRCWPRHRYIVDKVLHDRYDVTSSLVNGIDAHAVLLVRQPEQALPSILDLELPMARTDSQALDYYVGRLADVQELARGLRPDRGTFLIFDDLLQQTDVVLAHLTAFLDLSSPLTSNYRLLRSTGQRWVGDPGKMIHAGVVRKTARNYRHAVTSSVLTMARDAYDECVQICRAAQFNGILRGVSADVDGTRDGFDRADAQ